MTTDSAILLYKPLLVQANHWVAAARRLCDLDCLASPMAWKGLEEYVQPNLRKNLSASVATLVNKGETMLQRVQGKLLPEDDKCREIENFKSDYLRVETLLDFYADALATRTNSEMIALLKACDHIAEHSMRLILEPLGHPTPDVVTYIDKGMGASILKAGLRLWDNSQNPVAAIKIVRHNLLRPTALIHEAGHQVAEITNWNSELGEVLRSALKVHDTGLAENWCSWASEIAADLFAFVQTGFASVAALHDVVDGPSTDVLRFMQGDPHPISFLRVLVGTSCCRHVFGHGIWDVLHANWMGRHPAHKARSKAKELIQASIPVLPQIAAVLLNHPYRAFRGKSILQCIDARAVNPANLERTADMYGKSFYTSVPLLTKDPLLRLAWNGYQLIASPGNAQQWLDQQKTWMHLLGNAIR